MERFLAKLLYMFLTALGMIIGGSLIGSVSAGVTGHGPFKTMCELARDLKIWAAVAAIGGSFTSLQTLESGLLEGEIKTVIKQLGYIFSAFAGAHIGYLLILALADTKK